MHADVIINRQFTFSDDELGKCFLSCVATIRTVGVKSQFFTSSILSLCEGIINCTLGLSGKF